MICDNKAFILLICNMKLIKDNGVNKKIQFEKYYDKSIRMAVIAGKISKEKAEEFKRLWTSCSDEELGFVLEQLVKKTGPCNIDKIKNHDKSMNVKVKEANLETNFDIVFFDKKYSEGKTDNDMIRIEEFCEFHECKKSVETYFPCDINNESRIRAIRNKLELFRKTHDIMVDCGYYIPTFSLSIKMQQEFLDKYYDGKYSFIKIIKANDLEFFS